VPEISEIRGVDSDGVIATMLDRKLITTAGRKAVIGRPILYKTSKEFLLRFGLKDIHELPSMEEFEKLLAESFQSDLLAGEVTSTETPSDPQSSIHLLDSAEQVDEEPRDEESSSEDSSGSAGPSESTAHADAPASAERE